MVLRYSQQRGWSVQEGRHDSQPIRLRTTCVVTRMLVALHWIGESDIRGARVVFPDMLKPDEFRRLLVCLKITDIGYDA